MTQRSGMYSNMSSMSFVWGSISFMTVLPGRTTRV